LQFKKKKKRGKSIFKYFFFTVNTQLKNTKLQYKNNEKQLQTNMSKEKTNLITLLREAQGYCSSSGTSSRAGILACIPFPQQGQSRDATTDSAHFFCSVITACCSFRLLVLWSPVWSTILILRLWH